MKGSNDRTVAIWKLSNHGESDLTSDPEAQPKDELSYLTMVSEAEEVSLVTSFQNAHLSDINGVEFVAGDVLVTAGQALFLDESFLASQHQRQRRSNSLATQKVIFF